MNKKKHWETVYNTKTPQEVSWTQKYPKTSIEFIKSLKIDSSKPIIDVGGGDSHLVDVLIKEGFTDITVLDISEKALLCAQERLGENAKKVSWIVCDILDFKPNRNYSIWHDRAAFHFLTEASQIENYTEKVNRYVSEGLVIGTFSENGPLKCSGLNISQYDFDKLKANFKKKFKIIEEKEEVHITPFDTTQNFIFMSFRKKTD
jgi:hypothetical protein